MRVTKWEHMPLGIGATRLSHAMHGLEGSMDSQKIMALGKKIVTEEMAGSRKDSTDLLSHKG
jgi:small subunit ribosomal protein S10